MTKAKQLVEVWLIEIAPLFIEALESLDAKLAECLEELDFLLGRHDTSLMETLGLDFTTVSSRIHMRIVRI